MCSIFGENKHYGTPVNPAAPTRVPGGSSSGSAVAVAADYVDFSLGGYNTPSNCVFCLVTNVQVMLLTADLSSFGARYG